MSKKIKYTKEYLTPLVESSTTWREVCEKVGVSPISGAQTHISKTAKEFGIDFSHFPGPGWRKGMTFPSKRPIEDYLSGKVGIKSTTLKERLWKEGLKVRACEKCGISEWMGQKAPLELDHINRNHFDNRLENLQILCANCHSQRGIRRKKVKAKPVKKPKKKMECEKCGVDFEYSRRERKFCSYDCSNKNQERFSITKEELQELVWKMPTSKLSEQLGVSDVAIAKRCKKLGIAKPPRGYWMKKMGV